MTENKREWLGRPSMTQDTQTPQQPRHRYHYEQVPNREQYSFYEDEFRIGSFRRDAWANQAMQAMNSEPRLREQVTHLEGALREAETQLRDASTEKAVRDRGFIQMGDLLKEARNELQEFEAKATLADWLRLEIIKPGRGLTIEEFCIRFDALLGIHIRDWADALQQPKAGIVQTPIGSGLTTEAFDALELIWEKGKSDKDWTADDAAEVAQVVLLKRDATQQPKAGA